MFASDSAFRSQACEEFAVRGETLLFGGEAQGLILLADHLAHVADATRALGLRAACTKDLGRAGGASVDGGADFALADPVTVTDVQDGLLPTRSHM